MNPFITGLARIEQEIHDEPARQDAMRGERNHPDGTGGKRYKHRAEHARRECRLAAQDRTAGRTGP